MLVPRLGTASSVLLALSGLHPIQCVHVPAADIALPATVLRHKSRTDTQLIKRGINNGDRNYLNGLSNTYRGIFWSVAYPGADSDDGGCSVMLPRQHKFLQH